MNILKRILMGIWNIIGTCLVILVAPIMLVYWFIKDVVLPLD